MNIIELIINEEDEFDGIHAISIVEAGAIESNFIALKEHTVEFSTVDNDKRILMGAALIPNKPIYRKDGDKEYYIVFSKDTVRKASELFLKRGNQSNSTLEHSEVLEGLTISESWIVEDVEKDKSAIYGLDVPVGTWLTSIKVDNEDIWQNYVKNGKVKGFSIEGVFSSKLDLSKIEPNVDVIKSDEEEIMDEIVSNILNEDLTDEEVLNKIKEILKEEE